MVKRTVDMSAFWTRLRGTRSRSLDSISLPDGITDAQFRIFMRVMEANDKAALKDISTEEIALLYVRAGDLIPVVHDESVLGNPGQMRHILQKMESRSSRRRIM